MIFMEHLPIPTTSTTINIKDALNIQAITIWTSKQKLIIEPNYQKSGIPTCLHIDRLQGKLEELPNNNDVTNYTPHYFSAFVGILNLSGKKIIVLVQKVSLVMSIGQRDVFKVIKPVYLFYRSQEKTLLTEEESMLLINLTMILEQGMYFSYAYNLDQPLNIVNPNDTECQKSEKLNFNWASELQKQLSACNEMWRVSMIQGYVDKIQMIINGLKIFIFLISRRCISRSGTLYSISGRGIDKNGFTANFVETELILNVNTYFFSYLQTRGSVPVYWFEEQSYGGMNKSVKFLHGIQQNNEAFKNHLKLLKDRNDFEHVGLINLLNETSSFEKDLIQNYEYLVKKTVDKQNFAEQSISLNQKAEKQSRKSVPYIKYSDLSLPKHVSYAYFNIHIECAKKNYKPLLQFIEVKLRKLLHQFEFTVLKVDNHSKKKQVLNTQKGIFRINCMNCIDRSNIAQLSIGAYMIAFMLKHIQIEIPEFEQGISFILNDDSFTNLYREMWADNADALSKQYTGTGSTQSFAVRKGKLSYLTTIDHGMKSLARAIKNIRNPDEIKNKSIKLLTGYHEPPLHDSDTYIVEMKQMQILKKEKEVLQKNHQRRSEQQIPECHKKNALEIQKEQIIQQIEQDYNHTQDRIKDLQSLEQPSQLIQGDRQEQSKLTKQVNT